MQKFSLLFFLACFFPASPIVAEEKPAVECRKEDQTKTIDPHLQKLSESLEKITGHIGPDKIGLENGCVSMSFDDGYRAVFNDALPLFKKYGMVGTAYITTGVTNQDGYMTWDHIRELEQQGWEIGAHSDTHPEFEKIPLKEVKKEAFTSLDKLKKHGLKACGFAFPYGSYTQEDLALLSKKFCELRGFWDRDELNDPTSMNADLVQVKGVVKETTLDEIKSWLDQAKKEKRCLALVFHDLSEKGHYTGSPHHIRDEKGDVPADYEFTYNLPTLEAALQAVKDSGLPVVTESQMIKMPGKPVLSGNFEKKRGDWSLKSGAAIDHNEHGSFPRPHDSVQLDGSKKGSDDEALLSRTIDLQQVAKSNEKKGKMVFQAYFNGLQMQAGTVKIEVQELSKDGTVLRTIELSELNRPNARMIRQSYSPTDASVAKVRFSIHPKDLKGKVFVSNPVLNEY